MTEILILANRKLSNINTFLYINGVKKDNVESFTMNMSAYNGVSVDISFINENDPKYRNNCHFSEENGDIIKQIMFSNFKELIEGLRNEDSILLR